MSISIPLMIYLSDIYNTEGIALGRLATVVLTFPLLFFVEWRFLATVQIRFWLSIVWRAAIACFATIAFQLLILYVIAANRITFVAVVGAAGLVYLGLLTLIGYFSKEERSMARELVLGR